jgi:hypothetical protein
VSVEYVLIGLMFGWLIGATITARARHNEVCARLKSIEESVDADMTIDVDVKAAAEPSKP